VKIWDGSCDEFAKHRFAIIGENDVICIRDKDGNVIMNKAFVKPKDYFSGGYWNRPKAVEMKGLLIVWEEC